MPIPRPSVLVVVMLVALALGGCASQSELEAVQAELAACREEVASAEATNARWQERFDRAAERWDTMQDAVVEAVPNALAEIDVQRERILEVVPEQVQFEVGNYLDEYFDTVMQGFAAVRQDGQDIKLQLDATQKALAAVGADTRSISTAIDEAVASERTKRQQVADALADLHQRLVDFDRQRVDCKSCPERLKLNRNQRETIMAFHAELMELTSRLQQDISQ